MENTILNLYQAPSGSEVVVLILFMEILPKMLDKAGYSIWCLIPSMVVRKKGSNGVAYDDSYCDKF